MMFRKNHAIGLLTLLVSGGCVHGPLMVGYPVPQCDQSRVVLATPGAPVPIPQTPVDVRLSPPQAIPQGEGLTPLPPASGTTPAPMGRRPDRPAVWPGGAVVVPRLKVANRGDW